MSKELIAQIEATKEKLYYVDGRPQLSPNADRINAKVDEIIAIVTARESVEDNEATLEIARFAILQYSIMKDALLMISQLSMQTMQEHPAMSQMQMEHSLRDAISRNNRAIAYAAKALSEIEGGK